MATSPSHGGTHSPTELTHMLKGIDFPARRADLVQHAKKNHAGADVLREIEAMPDEEYATMAEVMKGFGQSH